MGIIWEVINVKKEFCVVCGKQLTDKQTKARNKFSRSASAPTCSKVCVASYMVANQKRRTLKERFYDNKFQIASNGCWNWTANIVQKTGYGLMMNEDHGSIGAHRASYIIHKGEIPDGFHIHHKCKNRKCVNPEHLEAIKASEHLSLERKGKYQKYCSKGHLLDGENLYNHLAQESAGNAEKRIEGSIISKVKVQLRLSFFY